MKKKMLLFLATITALISAQADELCMVSATPSNAYVGQPVTIAWTNVNPSSSSDWIGKYPSGQPLQAMLLYYTGTGKRSGSKVFYFNQVGDFQIQYFQAGSGAALSAPFPFTIYTDTNGYQLTITPGTTIPYGGQLMANWLVATNLSVTNDIVGYYSITNPSTFTSSLSVALQHSGSVYFTPQKPGRYLFGYFKGNSVQQPATDLITVDVVKGPVMPTWSFSSTSVTLSWYGYSGATYKVITSTDVTAPVSSWSVLQSSSGGNAQKTFTATKNGPKRFYAVNEIWN